MAKRTVTVPINDATLLLGVGAVIALYIMAKGGIKGAAAAAAGAVVDAGVAVVDETGQVVGLPALKDITTDPAVARWIIDNPQGGSFEASIWSSATALAKGQWMTKWSGKPPPAGSKIAQVFPPYTAPGDDYWPDAPDGPGI